MSTKFDDPSYLANWVKAKKFPAIHDKITYAALTYLHGPNLLDLCCSYGLLGARLKGLGDQFKKVIGIDGDARVVTAAMEAGMPLDMMYQMFVTPQTVTMFYDILEEHQITTVVARRAFPELFSENHPFGREVAKGLHARGVTEILLEGRIAGPRSTNSLARLKDEAALFEDHYEAQYYLALPNIALLTRREL